MEITVKHELGENTIKMLSLIFAGAKAEVAPTAKAEPVKEAVKAEPVKEVVKAEPTKVVPAKTVPAKVVESAKVAKEPTFDDLEDGEKLEKLKQRVSNLSKKAGNSANLRILLAHFQAARTSELNPSDYDEFNDFLDRYQEGESVQDITGGNLD